MTERLKFHLDEHISPAVADGLRRRGIDVTTTQGADLLHASDDNHLEFARVQGRVLVTRDDDFLSAPAHAGVVYAAMKKRIPIGRFVRTLTRLHARFSGEQMVNRVVYL